MLIKIKNGTPVSSEPSLCLTCRYSKIARGESDSQVHIECSVFDRLPFTKITECNEYNNKNSISLRDMRELAWVLVTDRSRQKIGFKPVTEWERENKDENLIPLHFYND